MDADQSVGSRGVRVRGPRYGGAFESESGPELLPFVLPGEQVELAGNAITVLQPAAARVTPGCVHFGACGGCQYQQAAYSEQVRWKQEILAGLLTTSGVTVPEIAVNAGEPWGYRNRIRLRLERVDGGLRVGYSERASNRFLPVRMCPIAAPLLWRAAEAMLALADGVYGRWLEQVAELELFATGDEGQLQISFFLRDPAVARREPALFGRLCEALRAAVPQLAGAGAELDPELNRRVRRSWDGAAWGTPGLNYAAGGRTYWVSRGSFFQVNRFLVERLVELVTAGQAGALAWDLFAGVGLFSKVLLESFERVVAVEAGASAARDLAQLGKGRGKEAFVAVRETAVEFLRARQAERERPELVVLDPPRAGLGVEGAALLGRIGPRRIVYVSCDPETLARDLAVLVRAGYQVTACELVDLFPQTFHLETVVELERG